MLINCVAYQEGKKLCDIPVEDISDYLDKPGCFVWVALRDATDAEMAQMKEEFNLHELAVEDAARGHQRPKIEEYGDCLFTVVHMLDLVDGDNIATGELAIFAGNNYVLSVRRDSAKGFLGVRARAEREPHLLKMGSAFVMYALMDAVVDRYFPVVDMLESELETIEDRIFTHGAQRENVERLYQLKRKGLVLRHAVFPLLEAIGRLHGGRVPPLIVGTQDYFRDVHDHLIRIAGRLDAIRDTISTAIQVNLSMVSIDESEVNKRLAAWAAIFAVFTAFAGVWGMNFKFMPELETRYGYYEALLVMGCCVLGLALNFKRKGWL